MVTAAKTVSQLATHMVIAFVIMYLMTGSVAFGGLAAILEPVCNVMLLPLHERLWRHIRRTCTGYSRVVLVAGQKVSQMGLHMGVAFAVIYWATGSLAFGGVAAILEPLCNVILLPFHDDLWEKWRQRRDGDGGTGGTLAPV